MGGLLYGPQYDMRDFGGRTITIEKQVVNQPWEPFYDTNYAIGETMTIEVEEDVADGVLIILATSSGISLQFAQI